MSDGREVIEPGDSLVTECSWDTSQTNRSVRGGLATSEEMCFNFLNVYPATNLVLCLTTSDATQLALCPTGNSSGVGIGPMSGAGSTMNGNASTTAGSGGLSGFKLAPQRLPQFEPYTVKEDCPAIYYASADKNGQPSAGSRQTAKGAWMFGLTVVGAFFALFA